MRASNQAQSDSTTQALRRLQEKERLLRESLIQAEKDQGQRQQVPHAALKIDLVWIWLGELPK
jgi:hypothetical protein